MAEGSEEVNIAGLNLLRAAVEGVAGRFIQAGHSGVAGNLVGNTGEVVGFPRLGFLGLPDGRTEGERGPLDIDHCRRAVGFHAVQFKVPGRQLCAAPPVLRLDSGADLQLCRSRSLNHFLQPTCQPDVIPVVNPDLQIVRPILFVVGIGDRQQVGLDILSNVHARKFDFHRSPASLIRFAHACLRFHGGRVSLIFLTGSGSASTIPAGKV